MNHKGVGSIFCLIAAILMSARYLAAAVFMSNFSTKSADLFAAGLQHVGSELRIAAIAALVVGICFLAIGIVKDAKNK